MNNALYFLVYLDLLIQCGDLRVCIDTLILRKWAISLQYFIWQKRWKVFSAAKASMLILLIITSLYMLAALTRRLSFFHRTREQAAFLDSLPRMQFTSDEQLITNVKAIYEKREFLEDCEAFSDVTTRIENYLLKNPKCTVAHLQCFYKLKEMRMVAIPFKHNLHRKYHRFISTAQNIRNQHLQKYLWFLFDEGRFERELFREAADLHTLALFEVYQYMNSLKDMPTWEPYVRIATMLKFLGHQVTAHRGLGTQKILNRVAHKYYPFVGRLFSAQEMSSFYREHKYDVPYLTYLCDEYVLKNVSQYDSYLQRVEFVELEQQYERILDIMVWHQFPAFLDLAVNNYVHHGGNDEVESKLSEIFFRLCEHADIDLETVTSILSTFLQHPNFMTSRRFPILTRCTDSVFNRSLQDFSYLPAQAYMSLMRAAQKLQIDAASREYLQKFICEKVSNKLVWNSGEVQQMREWAASQGTNLSGSLELMAYLRQIQQKQ